LLCVVRRLRFYHSSALQPFKPQGLKNIKDFRGKKQDPTSCFFGNNQEPFCKSPALTFRTLNSSSSNTPSARAHQAKRFFQANEYHWIWNEHSYEMP